MQTLKTNTNNSALVYPLKTILPPMPNKAFGKTGMNGNLSQHVPFRHLPEEHINSRKATTRFLIHSKDDVRVILFDEVVCCTAESNYTIIYLTDGSKLMVSRTLKDIASVLYHPRFFRIHASHLVNLNLIKRILKTHQCMVELPNNLMVEVSRSRRDELMDKMETL